MAAEEQRSSPRINITLPAHFLSNRVGGDLALASTINISAGGISLSCTEKLNAGQEIELQTILPTTGEKLKLYSKIIWVRELEASIPRIQEYRAGLKILDSAGKDELKFTQFYTHQLNRGFRI